MRVLRSHLLAAGVLAGVLSACQPVPPVVSAPSALPANPAAAVMSATAPFTVSVSATPAGVVALGTSVEIDVISEEGGFASVYVLSPNGAVTVLAENRRIAAQSALRLPGADRYRLVTRAPAGREHILVVVSREPLPGATVTSPPAVASGLAQQAFLDSLDARLDALPRRSWAGGYRALDSAG